MTWFTLVILSIFVLAGAELTQQYLLNLKESFDAKTSTVLTFLFQAIITIPILFVTGVSREVFSVFTPTLLPKILAMSFVGYFSIVLYFKSLRVNNISISAIFVSFSAIASTVMGIIFFSESVSGIKFFGIALVLAAIVIVNIKNPALEKNHFYGLLAGLVFGFGYVIDKSILLQVHPLVYIFWAFSLVAVWGIILNRQAVISSIRGKKIASFKPIALSGSGYFLHNFFTFTAYRYGGEVGRIDAINNAQVFLIILFEFFILKHTDGLGRKLFSAALAIVGIYLLGIAE